MQIAYENSFEHWVTTQIFNLEHLSSLKKDDDKKFLQCIVFLLLLGVFVFFTGGPGPFFTTVIAIAVFWTLHYFFLRRKTMRKLIFQRLKIAYGRLFDEETDKTVQWEITPELIIIQSAKKEYHFEIDSINKIVVCPQLLFVSFGLDDIFALPQRTVTKTDYNTFCGNLIDLYKSHVQQQQKEAVVLQSDWSIDMSTLKAKTSTKYFDLKFSLRKVFFTLLWGAVFTITGVVFCGLLAISAMLFHISTELLPYSEETVSFFAACILMAGSTLFGFTGLILGLFGKLPGTQ